MGFSYLSLRYFNVHCPSLFFFFSIFSELSLYDTLLNSLFLLLSRIFFVNNIFKTERVVKIIFIRFNQCLYNVVTIHRFVIKEKRIFSFSFSLSVQVKPYVPTEVCLSSGCRGRDAKVPETILLTKDKFLTLVFSYYFCPFIR